MRFARSGSGAVADRRLVVARLCAGIAAVCLPLAPRAQPGPAPPVVAVLAFGTAPAADGPDPLRAFLLGLRDAGLVEGRDVQVERRYGDGRPEQLAAQAEALVRVKVDVIVAAGPLPREYAGRATATIPIVAIASADPVREGWAQSLARPGGNITGLTVTFPELGPKRLELLKEAMPALERAALVLAPQELPDLGASVEEMHAAAARLFVRLHVVEVRSAADIEPALQSAAQRRCQALLAFATNTIVSHRVQLATLATAHRLLACSEFPLLAQAGFAITYGADLDDLSRRAAGYVKRILDGARPGELPIERPSKLSLVINLKAARAIGVTIPKSLLLRADEVIE